MDRVEALDAHLRSMSTERVARLVATLPDSAIDLHCWSAVLERIAILAYRPTVVEQLNLAQQQLLYAIATVAEDQNGLRRPGSNLDPGADTVELGPVSLDAVLDRIGARSSGRARARAEAELDRLSDLAILWPDGRDALHLADDFAAQFGSERTPPDLRTVAEGLDPADLHRMAKALGLDGAADRHVLTADIVSLFTDETRVGLLLEEAPAETARFAHFHALHSMVVRAPAPGHRHVDWLTERGLMVPVGDHGVMVPREAALVLRARYPAPFSPEPPVLVGPVSDREFERGSEPGAAAGARSVAARSQEALVALLDADDHLVAALRVWPLVLGADGVQDHPALREKLTAVGTHPDVVRVWVEAGAITGLLSERGGEVGLSAQAATWAGLPPESRITALLQAWTRTPDTARWWPSPEEPLPKKRAAGVRRALALALGDAPEGTSLGAVSENPHYRRVLGWEPHGAQRWLVDTVQWHQPFVGADTDATDRVLRALHEAERLGLVAYGTPTLLGRALSAWCRGAGTEEVADAAWAALLGRERVEEPRPNEDGGAVMQGPAECRERALAMEVHALLGT
ncbi:hypothetical protein [Nocardiopsis aegyptia]|uniref:Helicase XPB/Ssl2 N-terminal domain-containing protein n=1 Tax=Nocardiopsis aegyptia TaxID=220378 RepID=A0A7Z0ET34_9ACTN|nr:hypothetical protein [Nocardiopsis aegyptia]NYJ37781.1 hypothetical protein [Nocardiopsis aegyptia]